MISIHRFASLALTLAVATACGSSDSVGPGQSGLSSGSGGSTSSGGSLSFASGGTAQGSIGGTRNGSGGALPGSGGSSPATGGTAGANAGTGGTNASTGGSPGTGGSGGAVQIGDYPAGPYGNTVGATLTNLKLQGYVNATGDAFSNTLPFVTPYSLDDVRRTGKPYALIHVSEFSCPGCRNAATQLGKDGKGILDAGGAVLDILSTKNFIGVPTKADLDAWVTAGNEKISAFIDAEGSPNAAMTVATVRETAFIIQMPSMKIVWMVHGDVTGISPPSIVEGTKQMHTLLGK